MNATVRVYYVTYDQFNNPHNNWAVGEGVQLKEWRSEKADKITVIQTGKTDSLGYARFENVTAKYVSFYCQTHTGNVFYSAESSPRTPVAQINDNLILLQLH